MEIDRQALLRSFFQESEDVLSELEDNALDLDARPDDSALVKEMYRSAHTLKGSASCVGLERVMALAHEVESLFEAVTSRKRSPDRALSALAMEAVDLLRVRCRAGGAEEAVENDAERRLLRRIQLWLKRDASEESEGVLHTSQDKTNANAPRALRVDVDRLDRLLNLVGEVAIAEGRLAAAIEAGERDQELAALSGFRGLFSSLQESVMRLRLVPIEPSLERFRRAVRDISRGAGKQAELTIEGGEVEVDVTLADALRDPLMHMIRNAIDHGIERPERRIELGKSPVGRITLRARHDGNYVVVEVADDGAGIDTERLRERAAALGLSAHDTDVRAVHELAFTAGLSTADEVTKLSGRGIGMDVVRRDIESLRGSVGLESRPGQGLTVAVRVPLTVAVIQGFCVRVGEETYILPVDAIRECIDLEQERTMRSELGGVIDLRGKPLPFLDLGRRFTLARNAQARRAIVVLEHGAQSAGLEVDALLGEVQTVIKPLGSLFSSIKNVAGSAIMSDGRVALVLDVGSLLRSVAA